MFDFKQLEGKGTFRDIEEGTVSVPAELGAYVVWCVKENGNPKPIPRIFGEDQDGILFFGCTFRRFLNQRIGDFCKGVRRGNAHIEGDRYHNLEYNKNGFPPESLRIGWRIDSNANACETKWLDEYEKEFGELSPLNYQSGRKDKVGK